MVVWLAVGAILLILIFIWAVNADSAHAGQGFSERPQPPENLPDYVNRGGWPPVDESK